LRLELDKAVVELIKEWLEGFQSQYVKNIEAWICDGVKKNLEKRLSSTEDIFAKDHFK
ncbi:hypothetical protein MMC14_008635, partial [Varicellaria rhodocarpa]|nr:hypothetical protein [Varicellaria rhodocarpa]